MAAVSRSTVNPNKQEEMETLQIIRSLIVCKKEISTVKDVCRDYFNMEGEKIPYAKFGYTSLEDFLRSSDQFNFAKQAATGQVRVIALFLFHTKFHLIATFLYCGRKQKIVSGKQ